MTRWLVGCGVIAVIALNAGGLPLSAADTVEQQAFAANAKVSRSRKHRDLDGDASATRRWQWRGLTAADDDLIATPSVESTSGDAASDSVNNHQEPSATEPVASEAPSPANSDAETAGSPIPEPGTESDVSSVSVAPTHEPVVDGEPPATEVPTTSASTAETNASPSSSQPETVNQPPAAIPTETEAADGTLASAPSTASNVESEPQDDATAATPTTKFVETPSEEEEVSTAPDTAFVAPEHPQVDENPPVNEPQSDAAAQPPSSSSTQSEPIDQERPAVDGNTPELTATPSSGTDAQDVATTDPPTTAPPVDDHVEPGDGGSVDTSTSNPIFSEGGSDMRDPDTTVQPSGINESPLTDSPNSSGSSQMSSEAEQSSDPSALPTIESETVIDLDDGATSTPTSGISSGDGEQSEVPQAVHSDEPAQTTDTNTAATAPTDPIAQQDETVDADVPAQSPGLSASTDKEDTVVVAKEGSSASMASAVTAAPASQSEENNSGASSSQSSSANPSSPANAEVNDNKPLNDDASGPETASTTLIPSLPNHDEIGSELTPPSSSTQPHQDEHDSETTTSEELTPVPFSNAPNPSPSRDEELNGELSNTDSEQPAPEPALFAPVSTNEQSEETTDNGGPSPSTTISVPSSKESGDETNTAGSPDLVADSAAVTDSDQHGVDTGESDAEVVRGENPAPKPISNAPQSKQMGDDGATSAEEPISAPTSLTPAPPANENSDEATSDPASSPVSNTSPNNRETGHETQINDEPDLSTPGASDDGGISGEIPTGEEPASVPSSHASPSEGDHDTVSTSGGEASLSPSLNDETVKSDEPASVPSDGTNAETPSSGVQGEDKPNDGAIIPPSSSPSAAEWACVDGEATNCGGPSVFSSPSTESSVSHNQDATDGEPTNNLEPASAPSSPTASSPGGNGGVEMGEEAKSVPNTPTVSTTTGGENGGTTSATVPTQDGDDAPAREPNRVGELNESTNDGEQPTTSSSPTSASTPSSPSEETTGEETSNGASVPDAAAFTPESHTNGESGGEVANGDGPVPPTAPSNIGENSEQPTTVESETSIPSTATAADPMTRDDPTPANPDSSPSNSEPVSAPPSISEIEGEATSENDPSSRRHKSHEQAEEPTTIDSNQASQGAASINDGPTDTGTTEGTGTAEGTGTSKDAVLASPVASDAGTAPNHSAEPNSAQPDPSVVAPSESDKTMSSGEPTSVDPGVTIQSNDPKQPAPAPLSAPSGEDSGAAVRSNTAPIDASITRIPEGGEATSAGLSSSPTIVPVLTPSTSTLSNQADPDAAPVVDTKPTTLTMTANTAVPINDQTQPISFVSTGDNASGSGGTSNSDILKVLRSVEPTAPVSPLGSESQTKTDSVEAALALSGSEASDLTKGANVEEYVRGQTAIDTGTTAIGGTRGESTGSGSTGSGNPMIIGGRKSRVMGSNSGLYAPSSVTQNVVRYAACIAAAMSVLLLIAFHFTYFDASMEWPTIAPGAYWVPNAWEFAVYTGYLQQTMALGPMTLMQTPYFLWEFVDIFSWSNLLMYRDPDVSEASPDQRRLATILLNSLVGYADRIGADETTLIYRVVAGFAVVMALLLVVLVVCCAIARWKKSRAHQCLDGESNACARVVGLVVLAWFFSIFPLTMIGSFEVAMEVQARLYTTGPLLLSIAAIIVLTLGGLAIVGRALLHANRAELKQPKTRAKWGALYLEHKFGKRMFFVLTAGVQIATGVSIGAMRSGKALLLLLLVVHGAYLLALYALRPFGTNGDLAKRVTYAVVALKLFNVGTGFAFLETVDLSVATRCRIGSLYTLVNALVIVAWFVRHLVLFCTCVAVRSKSSSRDQETPKEDVQGSTENSVGTAETDTSDQPRLGSGVFLGMLPLERSKQDAASEHQQDLDASTPSWAYRATASAR